MRITEPRLPGGCRADCFTAVAVRDKQCGDAVPLVFAHGALNTVAVLYGVEQPDRKTFAKVMHENFVVLFPSEDVTADQMIASIEELMKADPTLAKYLKS